MVSRELRTTALTDTYNPLFYIISISILYYSCAKSTATRPITDRAQCTTTT
jgi:hypothetical protein